MPQEKEQLFPSLPLNPDTYPVEWRLDGKSIAGEVELLGNRPPTGSMYGEPEGLKAPSRGFPQDIDVGLFTGRLRMGQDIVFGDTQLSVWFPERSMVFGRWAIVGLGISSVREHRYSSMRLQITGFETLFGWAPIKHTTFPKDHAAGPKDYGFAVVDDVESRWADGTVEIAAEYAQRTSFMNPNQFDATFPPVMMLKSEAPLSVDEWVSEWAVPILRITAFTSGREQKMSWVTLHIDDPVESSSSKPDAARRRTAQLFGSGISQEPYAAQSPPFRTRDAPIPLFMLANLGRSFVDLVRAWRTLETATNPFLELYGRMMFNPDLPQRARFLYLIQALEALHWTEHQADDEAAQLEYETLRQEALDLLRNAGTDQGRVRRIERAWPKRRRGALHSRLRELFAWIGQGPMEELRRLTTTETARRLSPDETLSPEEIVARLRNELSHGGIKIDDVELRPWGDALDLVARTHLLRLLGFEQQQAHEAIDRAIESRR
jgi:HEPN superfamily Apea-like protein